MKPFNLEKALEGCPVFTRDGRRAEDFKFFKGVDTDPLYGNVEGAVRSWDADGRYAPPGEHRLDLFMAPDVKVFWLNIREQSKGFWLTGGRLYESEKDAKSAGCVGEKAIRVTWED